MSDILTTLLSRSVVARCLAHEHLSELTLVADVANNVIAIAHFPLEACTMLDGFSFSNLYVFGLAHFLIPSINF